MKPRFVEVMPEELEDGILYVSQKYELAIHLCACGCRHKAVTPVGPPDGWKLTVEGESDRALVTLSPSIGNWLWESPYHAHYFIERNVVRWC